MAITINTNVSANNAKQQLNKSQASLAKTFERLSTGLRINKAGDDAAGLAISERFTAQIKGLDQAVRNANDGISLLQTTEGGLQESTSIVQRMRELSVQSANASNSSGDRAALQDEMTNLLDEMDRISRDTKFNGAGVLDGSFKNQSFQVGANAGETIAVSIDASGAKDMGQIANKTGTTLDGDPTKGDAELSGVTINGLLVTKSSEFAASNGRGAGSAYAKAAAINGSNVGVKATANAAVGTESTWTGGTGLQGGDALKINDVEITQASSTENLTQAKLVDAINSKSTTSGVTASVNASNKMVLTASDGRNVELEFTAAATHLGTGNAFNQAAADGSLTKTYQGSVTMSSDQDIVLSGNTTDELGFTDNSTVAVDTKSLRNINITTVAGANEAMSRLDSALNTLGERRGNLGAIQNRLGSTISNLGTISQNVDGARSRIMDLDFASESVNMTKYQVLQQAGVSILAQSKGMSQIALNLLQ